MKLKDAIGLIARGAGKFGAGAAAMMVREGGRVVLDLPGSDGDEVVENLGSGIDDSRHQALAAIHGFPKRLGTPEDFDELVKTFMVTALLNWENIRLDVSSRVA